MALEPDTLANPAEVSDADAQAAYARVAGADPKFGAPEKRDLQQILFPNQAEADAAAAKIKEGASFDDIVKARGLKPEDIDLGPTAKDAIIDPSEAAAVFALPAGGVSGVLQSQFGPVIVRVKSIIPSTVKPFSEVAEDIKRRISAARAGDKIQALHDKIEDLRVSGKPLAEAAKEVGLTTLSVPAVDAQDKDPSGKDVALPDAAELLRSAFASDVGLDEAPIATKDGGFVWFSVNKVEPSHERSFEEARPQVEAQWRAEQVDKALSARASDLVKQLRDGASPADVAKSVGATVRTVGDIRRDDKDLPEAVVAAIFREPPDGVGSAATPDGRTVFKITADTTPPVEAIDPHTKQIAQAARRSEPPKPGRTICRGAPPLARRDGQFGRHAIRRRRLTLMTMIPDYEAFERAYRAGAATVAVTTLVADLETPVSAYLKLARGRAGNMFLLEVGRRRRAARPLFDDRPRSRPRLPLDRRARRNQPQRAPRARSLRSRSRRSARRAPGAARRIPHHAAVRPSADVGRGLRLSRLRHGAPDGEAAAGEARPDRRAGNAADPADGDGGVRLGARRDGDRDPDPPGAGRLGQGRAGGRRRRGSTRSWRRSKRRSTTARATRPTR